MGHNKLLRCLLLADFNCVIAIIICSHSDIGNTWYMQEKATEGPGSTTSRVCYLSLFQQVGRGSEVSALGSRFYVL